MRSTPGWCLRSPDVRDWQWSCVNIYELMQCHGETVRWSLCTLDSFYPQLFLVVWICAIFVPQELRSVKERNKSDVLKKISVNDVTLYGSRILWHYWQLYISLLKKVWKVRYFPHTSLLGLGENEEKKILPDVLAQVETLSFQRRLRGSIQSLGTWILLMFMKRENYWRFLIILESLIA